MCVSVNIDLYTREIHLQYKNVLRCLTWSTGSCNLVRIRLSPNDSWCTTSSRSVSICLRTMRASAVTCPILATASFTSGRAGETQPARTSRLVALCASRILQLGRRADLQVKQAQLCNTRSLSTRTSGSDRRISLSFIKWVIFLNSSCIISYIFAFDDFDVFGQRAGSQ